MSQYQGDEMDMEGEHGMVEVDDDTYFRGRVMAYSDSDEEEYDDLVCSICWHKPYSFQLFPHDCKR